MRVDDLCREQFLHLNPAEGVIHFDGQRASLVDAAAMGLLKKCLIEKFGCETVRCVLTQFGFAHGWCIAEGTRAEFTGGSNIEWREAAPWPATEMPLRMSLREKGTLSGQAMVVAASMEASQHLTHLGCSDNCTCWTSAGMQSGYLSAVVGKEILVVEDRCLGKGDDSCHFVARTREEWGEAHAADLLPYGPGCDDERVRVALRPVTDMLQLVARKVAGFRDAREQVSGETLESSGIVVRSKVMRELVGLARRVARVDSTVLITGESGTGKERIAKLVHEESQRASGPFIAVNCGAIAETLLETELFGHARGAFTGATQDRSGLFEAANGGTLLLDEVGEVSPGMQVKLLRALQEREVRRVGETKSRKVDVRVVAATNRDLAQRISGGEFRQDLYYRLKVVELHVPPLRERRDDILPLAHQLLAGVAARMKRDIDGLSPNATEQLLRYEWPGNVRELENAMERAVALARGIRIEVEDLPEEARGSVPSKAAALVGPVRPLDQVEKEHILAALAHNGGNQTHTAEQLQIGSATLYRKLKAYGALDGRRVARGGLVMNAP